MYNSAKHVYSTVYKKYVISETHPTIFNGEIWAWLGDYCNLSENASKDIKVWTLNWRLHDEQKLSNENWFHTSENKHKTFLDMVGKILDFVEEHLYGKKMKIFVPANIFYTYELVRQTCQIFDFAWKTAVRQPFSFIHEHFSYSIVYFVRILRETKKWILHIIKMSNKMLKTV